MQPQDQKEERSVSCSKQAASVVQSIFVGVSEHDGMTEKKEYNGCKGREEREFPLIETFFLSFPFFFAT